MSFEEIEKIVILDHDRYDQMSKVDASNLIINDVDEICGHYTNDDEADDKARRIISATFHDWHDEYFNDINITDNPYKAIRSITKGI
ncbi:MAG: hypothetical protein ACRC6B_07120 [Fusobacteriaceae bacterium]